MSENIPPDWAFERARELMGKPSLCVTAVDAFARYIAAHEDAPLDPLLENAREIAAAFALEALTPGTFAATYAARIREGEVDDTPSSGVQLALTALRRGIEIGRDQ